MNLSPKEFERLLCEFSKQDLPSHFTVEHDIKDVGEESKNYRQIDTKIKGRLGVSNILICGEAKNWRNPVGIETIDALVGKYMSGEIRANKVITFSNQGFTEPAIKRAKLIGIELLEPKELGKPIQPLPYIVAVGRVGQMFVRATHSSTQLNLMSINNDEYIILKGDERISFVQSIFRIVRSKLREIENKEISSDLSKIKVRDANVLYELKSKAHHKYNADFDVEVSICWDYYSLDLPCGILHHVNTNEIKFVHLDGDSLQTLKKVLLSPNNKIFENKEECIEEVIKKSDGYIFNMCLIDPDRSKINPEEPIVSLI